MLDTRVRSLPLVDRCRRQGRGRVGLAVLLWLEASAAAGAAATSIGLVLDQEGLERSGPDLRAREVVRRRTVAALFGLHTVRFWIYLRPDHGLRAR